LNFAVVAIAVNIKNLSISCEEGKGRSRSFSETGEMVNETRVSSEMAFGLFELLGFPSTFCVQSNRSHVSEMQHSLFVEHENMCGNI
jgi:hypothetical protein